jgi:signal transduction histidine kinase
MPIDRRLIDAARGQVTFYVSVGVAGIAIVMLLGSPRRGVPASAAAGPAQDGSGYGRVHELRTPLTSMRVLVDGLLSDTELDPVKTRVTRDDGQRTRLSRLIENFLTFSRLERNRHQFVFAAVLATIVAPLSAPFAAGAGDL